MQPAEKLIAIGTFLILQMSLEIDVCALVISGRFQLAQAFQMLEAVRRHLVVTVVTARPDGFFIKQNFLERIVAERHRAQPSVADWVGDIPFLRWLVVPNQQV